MVALKSRIRTNLLFGAIALLPVAMFAYAAVLLYQFMQKAYHALHARLGTDPYFDTGLPLLAAIVFLLVLCYLTGALVRTRIGTMTFDRVHAGLSRVLPGYPIISRLLRGAAESEKTYPPALVSLYAPGSAVLGFVMEDAADGYLTVYVPSSPVLTAGHVHVVEEGRVRILAGSSMDAVGCVGQWGVGLAKVRGDNVPPL